MLRTGDGDGPVIVEHGELSSDVGFEVVDPCEFIVPSGCRIERAFVALSEGAIEPNEFRDLVKGVGSRVPEGGVDLGEVIRPGATEVTE